MQRRGKITVHRLERMVRALFGPTAVIEEKFFYQSKKNQVTSFSLIVSGQPYRVIAKYFVWGEAGKEERILIECARRGISVPAVLHRQGRVLFLEHLAGETLSPERLGETGLLHSLAMWAAHYHEVMGRKHGTLLKRDMRPQNFIYHEKKLWGIDFEEASYGEREWDVADLISTIIEGAAPGEDHEILRRIRSFLSAYMSIQPLRHDVLSMCLMETLKKRIIFRKLSGARLERWIQLLEESIELF